MYCRSCGATVETEFLFCPLCGESQQSRLSPAVAGSTGSSTTGTTSSCRTQVLQSTVAPRGNTNKKPPTFQQYYDNKEKERRSTFEPKCKTKRGRFDKKAPVNESVTINIGMMDIEQVGKEYFGKPLRGQSLPLVVMKSDNSESLKCGSSQT